MIPTPEKYTATAKKAAANPVLQKALVGLQERFGRGTALAYQQLPEGPDLRHVAHDIRMHAIQHLDSLLDELAGNFRNNGGHEFSFDVRHNNTDPLPMVNASEPSLLRAAVENGTFGRVTLAISFCSTSSPL